MDDKVLDLIKDADKILIGIGESFEYTYGDFRDDNLKELEQRDYMAADLKKLQYRMEHPDDKVVEAYNCLYDLVKEKDFFVLSTCIDDRIYNSNIPEEKIVTPCGTYRYLQCSAMEQEECKQKLLPFSIDMIKQIDMVKCPVCGSNVCFNHVYMKNYNESGYLSQWAEYRNWLQCTINKKLCILELGVGLKFPNIIRWPFEKVGFYNNKASFIRVHETLYQLTEELSGKGVSVKENPIDFLLSSN